MAVVLSPGVRVTVAESLRSCTMRPQSSPLTIGGTVLKKSDNLIIFWVTFDSKLTYEKHLHLISRAASQRFVISRKSWRVFQDGSLLERCFGVLSCPFRSTVLQSGALLPIHTLNYWTEHSVVPGFQLGVCLSVTFLVVDPWQSCVCFIRSGVTQCTLLMVLYLDRIYQRGLHALLWWHIGTLMHRLAAEPFSSTRLLFHSRCPSGTILLTTYSMVWDWRVSKAGPMVLYWPKLLYPYYSLLLFFPFSSFCL